MLPFGCDVDLLSTLNQESAETQDVELQVYDKYDPTLHGPNRDKKQKFVNLMFMRKYVHLAKGLKPQLTKEAADLISEEYTKLRNQDNLEADHMAKTQPITARTLETLIRLATAHAKSRLSNKVEARDADAAIDLIRFACFKKVLEKEKKKRRKAAGTDDEEEEEEEEEVGEEEEETSEKPEKTASQAKGAKASQSQKGGNKRQLESSSEEEDEEAEPSAASQQDEPARKRTRRRTTQASSTASSAPSTGGIVTAEKLKEFKGLLFKLFNRDRAQSVSVNAVQEYVKAESSNFNDGDIRAALNTMQDDNQIMLSDDTIFLI